MIANIVVGICMTVLIIGFFYGIYMAYWGVWNEHQ
jgi:multisubunit Na+/H+ antiporter MnhC subunit